MRSASVPKSRHTAALVVVASDCLVTAGLVVTHLGITPDILAENYALLQEVVDAHPTTFAALDFGPLCPIPGSQSFRYLTHPEVAEAKATGEARMAARRRSCR